MGSLPSAESLSSLLGVSLQPGLDLWCYQAHLLSSLPGTGGAGSGGGHTGRLAPRSSMALAGHGLCDFPRVLSPILDSQLSLPGPSFGKHGGRVSSKMLWEVGGAATVRWAPAHTAVATLGPAPVPFPPSFLLGRQEGLSHESNWVSCSRSHSLPWVVGRPA